MTEPPRINLTFLYKLYRGNHEHYSGYPRRMIQGLQNQIRSAIIISFLAEFSNNANLQFSAWLLDPPRFPTGFVSWRKSVIGKSADTLFDVDGRHFLVTAYPFSDLWRPRRALVHEPRPKYELAGATRGDKVLYP